MSNLYISITVHAENERHAQFERTLLRPPRETHSPRVNDDELSRRLMELYQEAQDWLGANKPVRPIKDRPQA